MGLDLTGIGGLADLAKGIVDRLWPADMPAEKRIEVEIEVERLLAARENAVVAAQQAVMVAEMQQGDAFTKRARPSVVYSGLAFIGLVHVFLPMTAFFLGKPVPSLALPTEFWVAWSGVVGLWVLGRSAEKRGATDVLTKLATGSK